jgi:hypothetical protein
LGENSDRGIHWSFWVIGVVALIWNVMGGINFFMQMDPNVLATYPDSHRAIVEGRPLWATAGFAISVFGGALGGVLLLLRKPAAYHLFIASLLGTVVTMIHTAMVTNGFSVFDILSTVVMPMLVAVLLVWYSRWADRKGWVS